MWQKGIMYQVFEVVFVAVDFLDAAVFPAAAVFPVVVVFPAVVSLHLLLVLPLV